MITRRTLDLLAARIVWRSAPRRTMHRRAAMLRARRELVDAHKRRRGP